MKRHHPHGGYDPDNFTDKASLAKADEILADDPALVLVEALSKFMPIEVRETRDYAEITFGDHQTQAMTMAPDDWIALNTALDAYQSTDKGGASSALPHKDPTHD